MRIRPTRLVPNTRSDEAIDTWYKDTVRGFQAKLPKLESICIFSDWPWYYEGKRFKSVEKKDARMLPFRAAWPVGLRDDMPVDVVDDGYVVVEDDGDDVDMIN